MRIKESKIKLDGYIRVNWGTPFIIAFAILLVSVAVFLSVGYSIIADSLSVAAFYALLVGIILQLVCSVKYQKTKKARAA